jgi:hypothetical protein
MSNGPPGANPTRIRIFRKNMVVRTTIGSIDVQFLAAGLPQTEIIQFIRSLRPQLNAAIKTPTT